MRVGLDHTHLHLALLAERLANAVRLARQMQQSAPEGNDGGAFEARLRTLRADFSAAMDDDFNTPQAIASLQEFTREVNTFLNSGTTISRSTLDSILNTYEETAGNVLGILPSAEADSGSAQREAALIQMLIDLRVQARKSKNWAESDRIRDELAAIGVILEDRADGTVWKVG